MAKVAADFQVPIILMHNRFNPHYHDFEKDIKEDLLASIDIALQHGVLKENIILDPGIGFAKDLAQNLTAMRMLDQIVALGYPVLLGTSRKSMIGKVLDLPIDQRLEGTAATVAFGITKGCHMIRVHDVKEDGSSRSHDRGHDVRNPFLGGCLLDKIHIEGMTFYGTHGVLPEENRLGQRFLIDLELGLDLQQAAIRDV